MNYVHLSPHFPPNYHLFSVNLARLGATVLGLADEPHEQLLPELRGALTEYYRVGDMHNYDDLLRAGGHFTHRHGKIARLDSHTEYWMETEARLRMDFNIAGPQVNEVAAIKRKSLMKAAFQRAGVPAARGAIVHTLGEARSLVTEIGYPIVAKPDVGVGAANTFRIEDTRSLERFFDTKPPVEYLIEEYVKGTIQTKEAMESGEYQACFFVKPPSVQQIMTIAETGQLMPHKSTYFFPKIWSGPLLFLFEE